MRDVLDRLHIDGDIFTGTSVTTGCRTREQAVFIEQIDSEAVDFEFAKPADGGSGIPFHTSRPGFEFIDREDVVETHHPFEVLNRFEQVRDLAAHMLCW